MAKPFLYLDTEFYNTTERHVTPVCLVAIDSVTAETYRFWFPDDEVACRQFILDKVASGYYFCSYMFEAEARFLMSIGIDVLRLQPFCLYVLYRQLTNKNDEWCIGEHYDGEKVYLVTKVNKNKYAELTLDDTDEEENQPKRSVPYSLVGCAYRTLGVKINSEHKDSMRDRILKGHPFTAEEKQAILAYCEDDTKYLPEIAKKLWASYKKIYGNYFNEFVELSKYTVHSALMVSRGYPVLVGALKKLTHQIMVEEMEKLSIETMTVLRDKFNLNYIHYDAKQKYYKENVKVLKEHIALNYKHYEVSEKTGLPSISEEALKKLATTDYYNNPQTAIDYVCRYKKLTKSLKSFRVAKGRKSIYDFLGSDGRIRPNMGIFGAQSSRSQPASTSFIHLKAAVFRFLVHPSKGKCLFGIDYKSQEFLIAAANSKDKNMLEAYQSGDPYMYLAKNIGLCPPNATKETHPEARKKAKLLELALTYGMGVASVAQTLGISEIEASTLINKRANLYASYTAFKHDIVNQYKVGIPLRTPDFWFLGRHNDNILSVVNFAGQGGGAAVMRRAVRLCHEHNLDVIFTLHDALYFECDANKLGESIDLAADCMIQAFKDIYNVEIYVDICAWGVEGLQKPTKQKTPKGRAYTASYYLYEDKVSEKEQEYWHNVILDF